MCWNYFVFKKMSEPDLRSTERRKSHRESETENLKIQGERERGVRSAQEFVIPQEFVNG